VLACAPAAELEALAARLGAQLHGIAAPA